MLMITFRNSNLNIFRNRAWKQKFKYVKMWANAPKMEASISHMSHSFRVRSDICLCSGWQQQQYCCWSHHASRVSTLEENNIKQWINYSSCHIILQWSMYQYQNFTAVFLYYLFIYFSSEGLVKFSAAICSHNNYLHIILFQIYRRQLWNVGSIQSWQWQGILHVPVHAREAEDTDTTSAGNHTSKQHQRGWGFVLLTTVKGTL